MRKLQDRVALIYGGTSGLGRATAKRYAEEGAKVAIAGRSEERGHEVVDEIKKIRWRSSLRKSGFNGDESN